MKYFGVLSLAALSILIGCNQHAQQPTSNESEVTPTNLTEDVLSQLTWMGQPETVTLTDQGLEVSVKKGTDFFNNPEDGTVVGTAPYLHTNMAGDFVATALVQPDLSSQWNAVALMVYLDSLHWIKFGFENSDATGPGIVSVVTKVTSDDANGVVLNDLDKVWLSIVRKGNNYAMHWSSDGRNYKMARLTAMPSADSVKVGVEVQSPVGEMARHRIIFFDVNKETAESLRDINKQE